MVKEFRDFVTRGNLIELAVALILALAFAAVVAAFTNVVLSFVAAIFGGDVTFDNLTFSVNGTPIPYGAFLTALFTFVVVAFILFLVVRAYNAWKKSAEATVKACPFCATDIPLAATRCPHCTSELQAA